MINSVSTNILNKEITDNAPYTMEELENRLQQSEDDFAMGRTCTNAEVLSELRTFIDSL